LGILSKILGISGVCHEIQILIQVLQPLVIRNVIMGQSVKNQYTQIVSPFFICLLEDLKTPVES
jgi:hypothetical protein